MVGSTNAVAVESERALLTSRPVTCRSQPNALSPRGMESVRVGPAGDMRSELGSRGRKVDADGVRLAILDHARHRAGPVGFQSVPQVAPAVDRQSFLRRRLHGRLRRHRVVRGVPVEDRRDDDLFVHPVDHKGERSSRAPPQAARDTVTAAPDVSIVDRSVQEHPEPVEDLEVLPVEHLGGCGEILIGPHHHRERCVRGLAVDWQWVALRHSRNLAPIPRCGNRARHIIPSRAPQDLADDSAGLRAAPSGFARHLLKMSMRGDRRRSNLPERVASRAGSHFV